MGSTPPESPRKRVKLSTEETENIPVSQDANTAIERSPRSHNNHTAQPVLPIDDIAKEVEVGITCFLDQRTDGFTGILKKRYTDFLVNEILPDGRVVHLENLKPTKIYKEEPEPEAPEPPKVESSNISTDAENSTVKDASDDKADTSRKSDEPQTISSDDVVTLNGYFGEELTPKITALYATILAHPDRKPSHHPTVESSAPITDRTLRTQIHQDIRRMFNSRIESSTNNDGVMILTAAAPRSRKPKDGRSQGRGGGGPQGRSGKLGWQELGGEYLHFTIYKENKDTMEVISYIARELRMPPKSFQFAGTKDRRGVTVQRASAYRVEAGRMASLNRSLRNSAVGDYVYQRQNLELGELGGNEFVITLRDCDISSTSKYSNLSMVEKVSYLKTLVSQRMESLHTKGYFNYFGLQRFGTFASRTDTVGVALLQSNFKRACDIIFDYNSDALAAALEDEEAQKSQQDTSSTNRTRNQSKISSDDKLRALALHTFRTNPKASSRALSLLPRKFSAEHALVRHLSRHPKDFTGAIMTIPRNLRIMYAHAYQSLVWNFAVGQRWKKYGNKVVEGDLILVSEHKGNVKNEADGNGASREVAIDEDGMTVDTDGEVIVRPLGHDRAPRAEDMFERARPLSSIEASSGKYSMFDIVLPLPGFDVEYPANEVGSFYKEFMADPERGGGLDPHDMRRKQKDFSLSGGYRKILSRIGQGYTVDVKPYKEGEDMQFVVTDLERIRATPSAARKEDGAKTDGNHEHGKENGRKDDKQSSQSLVHEVDPIAEAQGTNVAVIISFKLGPAQYATMALRELTRGGIQPYKPDFGGGR